MMILYIFWLGFIIATCVVAEQKKLGVLSYFVFSLFLGPLALIISLLAPSRKDERFQRSGGVNTLDDAQREMNIIRESFLMLENRIAELEENIRHLGREDATAERTVEDVEAPKARTVDPDKTRSDLIPSEGETEAFEVVFGKYWLSRIGVVLFVLGTAFFISYTFQYLNAFAKIAVGYALAGAFLGVGHFLKQIDRYRKVAWGILGGGWGLLYLATYAMHYIEATRIITSSALELTLLAAVSFLTIVYNLRYNSWVITTMTFILAYVTVGLGGIDYSTVAYWGLILGGIGYLSSRTQWREFLLAGILGAYLTFLIGVYPGIQQQIYKVGYSYFPAYKCQLSLLMLTMSWVVFVIALFLQKNSVGRSDISVLIAGHLFNAGAFLALGLSELNQLTLPTKVFHDASVCFVVALSGIYFLISYLYRRVHEPRLIVLTCSMALFLLGLAIYLREPGLSLSFLWLLEMLVLFVIGVYYRVSVYRLLGWLLSCLVLVRLFVEDLSSHAVHNFLGFNVYHNILMISVAALSFFVLGWAFNSKKHESVFLQEERGWYQWFPVAGTTLLTVLIAEEVHPGWLSMSWTFCGLGILAIGFYWPLRIFRICALGLLSLTALRVFVIDMAAVNTIYKIFAFIALGVVLLGVSLIYSKFTQKLNQ